MEKLQIAISTDSGDEELMGILMAVSVMAKRLAQNLQMPKGTVCEEEARKAARAYVRNPLVQRMHKLLNTRIPKKKGA